MAFQGSSYIHIARENNGERLTQKIDNWRRWINVNKYGTFIAIISICHRIIYGLEYKKQIKRFKKILIKIFDNKPVQEFYMY